MKRLSERAYAAQSGLSRRAVQKARDAGRLVLVVGGAINATITRESQVRTGGSPRRSA